MKLRILGHSVRIRIQQLELETLYQTGSITSKTTFGPEEGQTLVYSLVSTQESEEVDARFKDGKIEVSIPHSIVHKLVHTDQVGIASEKAIDETKRLSILVEKDFKCLTPRQEDADAFPHPSPGHTC